MTAASYNTGEWHHFLQIVSRYIYIPASCSAKFSAVCANVTLFATYTVMNKPRRGQMKKLT